MAHGEIQRYSELDSLQDEGGYQEFHKFFVEQLAAAYQQGELLVPVEAAVNTLIACTSGLSLIRSNLDSEEQFSDAMRAFQSMLRGAFFEQS